MPQDIQKSVNWALALSEQRTFRAKDFQQQDNFIGIALAGWKMLNEDHLRVAIAYYQVVNSF